MSIKVICDICTREVRGAKPPVAEEVTAGYYAGWFGYAVVCDHCMWTRVHEYEKQFGKTHCNCNICITGFLKRIIDWMRIDDSDFPNEKPFSGEERNLLVDVLNQIFKR